MADACHPEDCTNKCLRRNTSYKLHDHVLDVVGCNKYNCLNISEFLSWKKQVEITTAKASRILGFLRCTLRDCSKEDWSSAYSAMVQPTLDYASTTWDPHNKEDINTLDIAERRGGRFVCNSSMDRTPRMCHCHAQQSRMDPSDHKTPPPPNYALQDTALPSRHRQFQHLTP